MKKRLNNLFFIIGIITVVIMCCSFDVSFQQLWYDIRKAGYWLIAILALWFVLYIMNTISWRIIIKGNDNISIGFCNLLKLTITGFALNSVTPIGLLGGEGYKIMMVSKYINIPKATSSVILFSMMHIFSHFWFWLTAIVTYIILAFLGYTPINTIITSLLIFASIFCFGGIYLFIKGYKYGMTVRFFRFISRIPGLKTWGKRFYEKNYDNLTKIDRQISELHSQDKRSFYSSFFLEYIGRLMQSFEIFFMLIPFGINNNTEYGYVVIFLYSFIILAFTSLFANILGFMPMQVGGREGGFVMSVVQLGLNAEIGIFIGIICRIRELFWIIIGLILMKINKNT